MTRFSLAVHRRVISRARKRCEYCRLAQKGQEATFHIDHVVPRSKNGPTTLANLALACVGCSLHKSARLKAIDPDLAKATRLYNPRKQKWSDHFKSVRGLIIGKTSVGRATVSALRMNRAVLVAIRKENQS